tara:strand:- start:38492 stop:42898 length:4407 start_codon:yes stop_codon:yes gene_type:complete
MGRIGASDMSQKLKAKSFSIVTLFLLSSLLGLVALPTASAVNETTKGTITGVETWTGTMNLQGDIEVAEGAKLVVNAGTTVNIPYGNYIDVKGAICIGDSACGASAGSSSNQARFIWSTPSDYSENGWCLNNQSQLLNNPDTACGSGMIIRDTIDQSLTSLNYAHFENGYGHPTYVATLQQVQYGVLVFDGSSTTARGLTFKDTNTSNVLAIDFASPTITDSEFELGIDGQGYDAAAVRAYGAGAGILSTFKLSTSVFTGNDADCGNQGGGRAVIYIEDSYVDMDDLEIKENAYGVLLKQSSGSLTNSDVTVKCNAIDTNSLKTTGTINHLLTVNDNIITTEEGAGITAYDGANVYAEGNTISGAAEGSGVGIRSSTVELHDNVIGPIGGWNGLWIYGTSDVVAENNTIKEATKEPVLIGEYHYQDQGWQVPAPTAARLYFANNIIQNSSGTCNSQIYGGDFTCPAIHVFMSSATIMDNTITGNTGDIIRAKGGLVNVQRNTADSAGGFAGNISMYDNNYGDKYGSVAYFSGNTWTGVSQVYNVTESRVTVQSEQIPSPGYGELYPISISWEGAECPFVQTECLQLPGTAVLPPAQMPLAIELVDNATVFSYADLQNFDSSMIHVQNQNTAWGSQVREGELVRYQVKAKNSNVQGATVIIKDATGLPLYELTTDAFGFTQQVSLPSDFLLDRNWNHQVGDKNAIIPGSGNPPVTIDEDSCADGIDNDGDTMIDGDDADCINGREMPFYSVEAFKFGSGTKDFSYVLSGPIDDVINLDNLRPSVSVTQQDGVSFATTVTLTGQSWDGVKWPYPNDNTATQKQFGTITAVEVQPPGTNDWYSAVDTSGANGVITMENHPFKDWSFDWDMSAHPEGEGDVTFRVRSYDGLDYSPVTVRLYKLNLVAPTIVVDVPNTGSTHTNGKVLFQGTASDPYSGTYGSDVKKIWFHITSVENDYVSHFYTEGSTSWSYEWDFSELLSGEYTFEVWASDSDFCIDEAVSINDGGVCVIETRILNIVNENTPPQLQLSWIGSADQTTGGVDGGTIRASTETTIVGVARDIGGQVTRVEIDIVELATSITLNNGPLPVTSFNPDGSWVAIWDTSKLDNDGVYEVTVRAYDGEDYSPDSVWRMKINNPINAENIDPVFNETGWVGSITIFCDIQSNSIDRCGGGASIDLTQFFSDPDGIGETADALEFFILDNEDTLEDDSYQTDIRITSSGIAIYDPMEGKAQTTSEISEWSLNGVMFYAEDVQESKVYATVKVNFLVRGVAFSAERVDEGPITPSDPATFRGEGLPGSTVNIRFANGNAKLNSTRVLSDGTWEMDLTNSQLGIEGNEEVIFEMDGQVFKFAGQTEDGEFSIVVSSGIDEDSSLLTIILVVGAIVVLLGVGAFFFVEFEEIPDISEEEEALLEVAEDPYAWAKAKQTPTIPQQEAAPAEPEQQVAETSTHPGWIWDQATNQWVPDPNYSAE